MKNFLNKVFVWACLLLSIDGTILGAQPIQLVPKIGSSPPLSSPSLLKEENTGFWVGTPPTIIETHFPNIPKRLSSPLLRTLRRDLLKEKYDPLLHNTAYEKDYFRLLIAEGQWDQAKEFLLESNLNDKDTLLLELEWIMGKPHKACEKITNLIHTSPQPNWKMQNVYCLFLNGEEERGKIAAELLSESNPEVSLLLNTLFESSSFPPYTPSIGNSPFLLTVWCATGQDIPETTLKDIPSSFLPLIVNSEEMPIKTRLLAAGLAYQDGILNGEAVRPLLKNAPAEEFLAKFATALKSPKVETLLPLIAQTSQTEKLRLLGEVFEPVLANINPSLETLPLAPSMIRIYLAIDKKGLAQTWSTFFLRESPEEAIALLPLLHLAFSQTKWGEAQLQAWQAYQHLNFPHTSAQNSYMLRRILEALGEPPGTPLKGEPPPPSWRQGRNLFDEKAFALLESAADSKRKGEVLLLTLTLIGETPLKDLSVDKLVPLLRALHKAGFILEARTLGLEFLLDKGI